MTAKTVEENLNGWTIEKFLNQEKDVKYLERKADEIIALADETAALSDDALREKQ